MISEETRKQVCTLCAAVMVEDWNLAPIGSNDDNTERIYEEDTYLCNGCYDNWCTKYDIQPLEGE
jgi:RNA polymerase subunit RPABC4/transcription elongation factor Spt4